MNFSRTLALLLLPPLLASCGIFKTEEQKRAERTREKPLEVPPDLTQPTVDGRFAVPDPRLSTSYSDYSRERAAAPQGTPVASAAVAGAVAITAVTNARIERAGDQRWIVAKSEPANVYAIARDFWMDMGFSLARETPEAGILETNWRETRAKVETEGLRGQVSRFLPGMYSSGERDRFRTRIEKGTEPGTTEVYVSHRGLEEVYPSKSVEYQDSTKWVPRGTGTDRDLEAEMLVRLLARLGEPAKREGPATQPLPAQAMAAAGGAAKGAPVMSANAVLQNSGAGPLVVNDGFDRAWRRVGLALDRTGFTVEDRDRSKGVFFVRYIDPDAAPQGTGEGWLDKLTFWKAAPKTPQPQYRIVVAESSSGSSQVTVQNMKGEPENSPTGKRILALLHEQLK